MLFPFITTKISQKFSWVTSTAIVNYYYGPGFANQNTYKKYKKVSQTATKF